MNFLDQILGNEQQPSQNALAGTMAPDPRMQRYMAQGMSAEQAQAIMAKEDALRAAASQPSQPRATPFRMPLPTIGVRG